MHYFLLLHLLNPALLIPLLINISLDGVYPPPLILLHLHQRHSLLLHYHLIPLLILLLLFHKLHPLPLLILLLDHLGLLGLLLLGQVDGLLDLLLLFLSLVLHLVVVLLGDLLALYSELEIIDFL